MTFRVLRSVVLTASDREALAVGNRALQRLRDARQERTIRLSFPGLASWLMESFIQFGLYRIVQIGTGMSAEWNKERFLNAIILSRSLIETVGVWFRVLDDTYKLLPSEDIRRIHSALMVATFGSRNDSPNSNETPDEQRLPVAVNALTGIDRMDRIWPGARKLYDGICEYVHPNRDGHLLFAKPDFQTGDAELGEHVAQQVAGTISDALIGAQFLGMASDFHQRYLSTFRKQVEDLDRKFGAEMASWPGDRSQTWGARNDYR